MEQHDTSSFELLLDIQNQTDDEIKRLAEELAEEERAVSKKRRIIHAKLDLLRAEMVRRLRDKHNTGGSLFEEVDVEKLSAILSSRGLAGEEI
ncbi:MAG: RsiG family protein [Thermoleophilia bacterium]